jgi:hypothetical protein
VTDIALPSLFELIKLETDTECRWNALEAISSLICADEDDFEEGDTQVAKQTLSYERIKIFFNFYL